MNNQTKKPIDAEELQWRCVSHWLYVLYQNYANDKKTDINKPEDTPCSTCDLVGQCFSGSLIKCAPLNFEILNSVNGGQKIRFGLIKSD